VAGCEKNSAVQEALFLQFEIDGGLGSVSAERVRAAAAGAVAGRSRFNILERGRKLRLAMVSRAAVASAGLCCTAAWSIYGIR